MDYRTAMNQSLHDALTSDPDLRIWRSERRQAWGVDAGAADSELVRKRLWVAPDDVSGLPGLCTGAALGGMRLVVELAHAESLLESAEELVFELGELSRLSQRGLPVVFRAWLRPSGDSGLGRVGAHPLLIRCPWLKVLAPSSVRDSVTMFRAALASASPVLLLEHAWLLDAYGDYPTSDMLDSLTKARVLAPGADIVLATLGAGTAAAMQAAVTLKEQQVSAEVIDLRSLSPIDYETIVNSVRKTGRLLLIEGDYRTLGAGAEIAAFLAEHAIDELDAPIVRLDEEQSQPTAIVTAALDLMRH